MQSGSKMEIIQEINVVWSKLSQSGEKAKKRDAVPEAIVLPKSATSIGFHQKLWFGEQAGFDVPEKVEVKSFRDYPDSRSFDGYPGHTRREGELLIVSYTYDENLVGAPYRGQLAREVLNLGPGEWGRIIYNGRFSAGREWRYKKTVINVVNAVEFDANLLLKTQPKKVFRDIANLL
jgi:hypothetical protein